MKHLTKFNVFILTLNSASISIAIIKHLNGVDSTWSFVLGMLIFIAVVIDATPTKKGKDHDN